MLPYRNDQIISAIRNLYFTAGYATGAFACRFQGWFPIHQGDDGVMHQEVPIPMVALVATAVSK
jgi:hypothetical protein